MSRKVTRTLSTAMFVLGCVGITTSAGPVKAAFVSRDNTNLVDANEQVYRPQLNGACYTSLLDSANNQWALLSPVYWFGTAPDQIVFVSIVSPTGTVWDGGWLAKRSVSERNRTVQSCFPPPF